jgi:hypothetical protein
MLEQFPDFDYLFSNRHPKPCLKSWINMMERPLFYSLKYNQAYISVIYDKVMFKFCFRFIWDDFVLHYVSLDFDDPKFKGFMQNWKNATGQGLRSLFATFVDKLFLQILCSIFHRVHEADAVWYGACLDMYLKHKNKYKMCVFYEDLVKNPMVKK